MRQIDSQGIIPILVSKSNTKGVLELCRGIGGVV
jgi:hypothetical protein